MPTPPLQYGETYHIYNRGNNRENIFIEEKNYRYFLKFYAKYVEQVADTFAYCLMQNHFHFLVRIREEQDIQDCQSSKDWQSYLSPSQAFSNLFSTYTKAINKAYQRTGSLFQKPFQRLLVTSDEHLFQFVTYIHRNPVKHGFIQDFREWPYSSYSTICSTNPTRLQRDQVLDWFDGRKGFEQAHLQGVNTNLISYLIQDD